MQVIDLLAAIAVAVDDQAVAALGDTFAPGQFPGYGIQMPDERFVLVGHIIGGRDRLIGHDQDVDRGARMDVAESGDAIVLKDDIGRDFARNDAFEQRGHGCSLIMGHNGRKQESALKLRPEDLANHLAGPLRPVYLLVGEDPLLVTEASDAIRARAREQGFTEREVFQIQRPSTDAFLPAQHAAEAMSLFASRRIIEIRLPGGKPGHGEAGLVRVIEAAGDDLLVLIIVGKIERDAWQSDWLQLVEQRGVSLTLWPVDLMRFPDWLRSRFRAAGLVPDPEAIALLIERTEGNLLAARQEIEKLALLLPAGARVDAAAVAASSGASARFDVFQLGKAVSAGDATRALRLLAGLRAEGTEPVLVLWSLLRARAELAGNLPRGARRPGGAAITARAVRADRMAKGRLKGDVWDELMLLVTELCGLRVLALSRWQLRSQGQA